jgi:hypothetical protein
MLACGILVLTQSGTWAQQEPPVRGSVFVAAKAIPLPPGDWVKAGAYLEPSSNVQYGGLGYRHLVLTRELGGRIVGLVEIRAREPANSAQDNAFVPFSGPCRIDTTDLVPLLRDLGGLPSFRCRRIGVSAAPWTREAVPPQLADLRARHIANSGITPARFVQARISVGDQRGIVQLTYSFLPEDCGMTRAEQGERLRAWADALLPLVVSGFNVGAVAAAPACR